MLTNEQSIVEFYNGLVRSQKRIKERLSLGDCFLKEITEKGKVLYESTGG